ncbi:MAG: hypothetical protein J5628_03925 [Lachnospiraceae bacterium]|nr:hypothetical protein [Lachnospiraceae bacterium]
MIILTITMIGNVNHALAKENEEETCDVGDQCVVVSESSVHPLSIRCSSLSVEGKLFSNCQVDAKGYNNTLTPDGCCLYTYGIMQEIFDRGIDYRYHTEAYLFSDDRGNINDYSEQETTLYGDTINCGSLVGAAKSVCISGRCLKNGDVGVSTNIFSLNESIRINSDTINLVGLIYAPNGVVEINANEVNFVGVIIADEVIVNANKISLTSDRVGYDIDFYRVDLSDNPESNIMEGTEGAASAPNNHYYFNTGGSFPGQARYNEYNIAGIVKLGDIVYEAAGFRGLTGHIAVVYEFRTGYSVEYSTGKTRVVTYPNVVEAISAGVKIGLLDDQRIEDRYGTILRLIRGMSSSEWNKVHYFLSKQIGKPYNLDLSKKDSSIDEKDWYCSELAWAAFYYAGIDIEPSGMRNFGVGITPRDVKRSLKLYQQFSYD